MLQKSLKNFLDIYVRSVRNALVHAEFSMRGFCLSENFFFELEEEEGEGLCAILTIERSCFAYNHQSETHSHLDRRKLKWRNVTTHTAAPALNQLSCSFTDN